MLKRLLRMIARKPAAVGTPPARIEPTISSERQELLRKAMEIQAEKQKLFDALDDATKLKLMAQLMQPPAHKAGPADAKPAARKPATSNSR